MPIPFAPSPWSVKVVPDMDGHHYKIQSAPVRRVMSGELLPVDVAREIYSPEEANLLAAAPDLLDALRRVMRHIPANAGGASLGDDMWRARQAINKATGKA